MAGVGLRGGVRVTWSRQSESRWTAALLAAMVPAVGLILWWDRRAWFRDDDWSFISPGGHPVLAPNNEHWSTVAALLFRPMFAAFAMRSYTPYLVPVLLAHLAAVLLLWILLRRIGVATRVAFAISLIALFLGSGANDIDWAFQVGFVLPVALGLAWMLLLLPEQPGRKAWAIGPALGVVSLASSGVGVVVVFAAGAAALLRHGWRAALAQAGPPALVYVAWLRLFGMEKLARDRVTPAELPSIVSFVLHGYAHTFSDQLQPLSGLSPVFIPLGAAVALALGALSVRALLRSRRQDAVAVAMFAAAGLLFLLAGAARVRTYGVGFADQQRYVYVAFFLVAPLVGVEVTRLLRRRPGLEPFALALLAFSLAVNLRLLDQQVHNWADYGQVERAEASAILDLHAGGQVFLNPRVDQRHDPFFTVSRVIALDRAGAFGRLPPSTEADQLRLLALTAVVPDPAYHRGADEALAAWLVGANAPERDHSGPACVSLPKGVQTLRVSFLLERGLLALRAEGQGTMKLDLPDRDGGSVGASTSLPLRRDRWGAMRVALRGRRALLRLRLSAPAVMCGALPQAETTQ